MEQHITRDGLRARASDANQSHRNLGFVHLSRPVPGAAAVVTSWREFEGMLPPPGTNALLVTDQRFTAARIIPVLLQCTCERLVVTTFNIAPEVVEFIQARVASGDIRTASILVNGAMRRMGSGADAVERLLELAETFRGRVRVKEADIHAKLICMAMASGDFWVVEGSGNMAANAHIELYSVFNDRSRFMFHAGWVGELL